MDAYYVVAPTTKFQTITTATKARASTLGCTLCTGDPSGKATVFPSAVVLSTALTPAVFADTADQATVTEVTAAKTAATKAEAAAVTNEATVETKLRAVIGANQTWITAADAYTFPLTTAEQKALVLQTKRLSRDVNRLVRKVLTLLAAATGTTT